MEERFLTGYCRAIDQSRTVCAELEEGVLTYIDCSYPTCPHAPTCPIAQQLPPSTSTPSIPKTVV